jgi:hypothetical protein
MCYVLYKGIPEENKEATYVREATIVNFTPKATRTNYRANVVTVDPNGHGKIRSGYESVQTT